MNALLLDSSVILAAFDTDDSNHDSCHELLFGGTYDINSIDLVRYEVANVATSSWGRSQKAPTLLAITETLGGSDGLIRTDMAMMNAASAVASKHGISVYDAAYVAAAQAGGRTLVSCDERDLISRGLAVSPSAVLTTGWS